MSDPLKKFGISRLSEQPGQLEQMRKEKAQMTAKNIYLLTPILINCRFYFDKFTDLIFYL